MAMIYLGTSGYVHKDWSGLFYPNDLPQAQWLEYYSHHFATVEIEATFFSLPASPVFRHWSTRTPKDFRFVLKGGRSITHQLRLRECHDLLAEFFERASELGNKLSGVLWQLPPKFTHDPELLEDFLAEVERAQVVYGKFRQAFEFQDISWFSEEVYDILRQFGVAIVIADWPFEIKYQIESSQYKAPENSLDTSYLIHNTNFSKGQIIRPMIEVPLTADFYYLRLHGPAAKNTSPYSLTEIEELAHEVRRYATTDLDAYIFFNNNAKAFAVANAQKLQKLLG